MGTTQHEPDLVYHHEVKVYTGRWGHNPPRVVEGHVVRVPHSGTPWRLEDQPDAREWHSFHATIRSVGLLPVFSYTQGEWDYFDLVRNADVV